MFTQGLIIFNFSVYMNALAFEIDPQAFADANYPLKLHVTPFLVDKEEEVKDASEIASKITPTRKCIL